MSLAPSLIQSFNQALKYLKDTQSFTDTLNPGMDSSPSHLQEIKNMVQKKSPPEHAQRLMDEFFGLGPISPLIHKPEVTEIIINGKDHIFYEEKGSLKAFSDSFLSELSFKNFIHRVCEEADIILSLNQPFADGNFRGLRVHLAMQPLVNVSFHISFRRHPKNPWSFKRLKDQGWAPAPAIDLITRLIESKKNLLIAGPTSSGKTSVLNSCLRQVALNERLIIVEDCDELLLPNTFSTKLLTRGDGSEGLKPVGQQELVRQSLRMRPDRIIMGEARGTEAKDLLMALATGHKGSIGTIHAKDHKQALWRLEMLVQMGAPHWSTQSIRQMIVLSMDYVILVGKVQTERKLLGIYKLSGVENTGYLFETLFAHDLNAQVCELSGRHRGGSL